MIGNFKCFVSFSCIERFLNINSFLQDVEDDERVGVKSTALLFGDQCKTYLTVFSVIMMTNLLAVGINTSQTWPFYFGLIGVTSHLAWQVLFNIRIAIQTYVSNSFYFFSSLLLSQYFPFSSEKYSFKKIFLSNIFFKFRQILPLNIPFNILMFLNCMFLSLFSII